MLGPLESLQVAYRRGFTFQGRSSRSEFWWPFFLLDLLACLLVPVCNTFFLPLTNDPHFGASATSWILFFLLLPLYARRLHDRNMSAWWLLLGLLPVLGTLILLLLFCFKGTEGQNRFGDDPLRVGFYEQLLNRQNSAVLAQIQKTYSSLQGQVCTHCQHINTPTDNFCAHCGQPLVQRPLACPKCGSPYSAAAQYCTHCGYRF